MHLRYRFAMTLVALSLALAAPAMAAKTVSAPLNGGTLPPMQTTQGAAAFCSLGQPGAASAFEWFFPNDDYYYTFFDWTQCGCSSDGLNNLVVHIGLFWPSPCTIDVQTWIVKAIDTGGGCFIPQAGNDPPDPDPADILCGPTAILPLTGAGLVDHAIPLPPCACLKEPAFILWKIVTSACPDANGNGAIDSPALVVDGGSPDPCVSYNGFLGGAPTDMLSFGLPGNTTTYVDADCCPPTQSLPGSWGKIKTLYR